jgi:hypothetical protein
MAKEKIDLTEHILENGGEDVRIYFKNTKKSKLYHHVKTPFLLFDALRKVDPDVHNYVVVKSKTKPTWKY